MTATPCAVPTCPALAAEGSPYCPVHRDHPELREKTFADLRRDNRDMNLEPRLFEGQEFKTR